MTTRVLLTIDTELAWRHHRAGHDWREIYARSIEPAAVGLTYQLARLAEHGLKATFFVDPMPALVFGDELVKRIVAPILEAGQEIQLHLPPNWTGASADDAGQARASFELIDYPEAEQTALIAQARNILIAAGAPAPVAFRSGSYSANDATLRALAALGFRYDSSHNGADSPWPSAISLPAAQIAPVRHEGVIEVPVTLIGDGRGRFRTVQICALSFGEMRACLSHALVNGHPVVTIVLHSFELSTRSGAAVNRIHRRRFEALCAWLADRDDRLPTAFFTGLDDLPLDRPTSPVSPALWRRTHRRAEQLWSNLVLERAA